MHSNSYILYGPARKGKTPSGPGVTDNLTERWSGYGAPTTEQVVALVQVRKFSAGTQFRAIICGDGTARLPDVRSIGGHFALPAGQWRLAGNSA